MKMNELPQGWGDDEITKFFEQARRNSYSTFQSMSSDFKKLIEINDYILLAEENMNYIDLNLLVPCFFFRAHSAFLAAVRLTIATQIPEAYLVLRNALEWALYGLFIHKKAELWKIWIRRHDSNKNKKEVRNIFKIGYMFDLLKKFDPLLHKKVKSLYEWCIDFGAHPNEFAIAPFYEEKEMKDIRKIELQILTDDSLMIKSCIKICAIVGVLCLNILELIMPERFKIIGLSNKLDNISKTLFYYPSK